MKNERNYIKEFRMKLTEAGITDPLTKIELMQWFADVLLEQYRRGAVDVTRPYVSESDKMITQP